MMMDQLSYDSSVFLPFALSGSLLCPPHHYINRLITEVKEWCSVITQMVDDAGKKLVEEVMSSANPALLKFVKNENICSLLNQANIGFLTTVPASSVSVQTMKKELTTIQEVEVGFCF